MRSQVLNVLAHVAHYMRSTTGTFPEEGSCQHVQLLHDVHHEWVSAKASITDEMRAGTHAQVRDNAKCLFMRHLVDESDAVVSTTCRACMYKLYDLPKPYPAHTFAGKAAGNEQAFS